MTRRTVLAALVLAACHAPEPARRLPLSPCWLSARAGAERVRAECGTLSVFEDRAAGAGKTIPLRVAVLRARGSHRVHDPLFMLAGGPGESAVDAFPTFLAMFPELRQTRDVVLVDQRGTGESNPLECPKSDALDESDEQQAARLRDCLPRLQGDPRLYTTTSAVDDLEDVRVALGYSAIDLYGGSYGTRVALAYLRGHGGHVRAAVLDGVAPTSWAIGGDLGASSQRTIDMLFGRCAADLACHGAFPDPQGDLQSLLDRLEKRPETVSVAHPVTGETTTVKVTREVAAATVVGLSYESETASLIPLLLRTARTDVRPLAAQTLMMQDRVKISDGMHLSVLCAEDEPFLPREPPATGGGYLGDFGPPHLHDACRLWPHGEVPPHFHDPVTSAVPTLLLSGELDPVTGPANGEAALASLSNGRHLVVPGEGHGALIRGCVPRLVARFLDRPDPRGLDASCLASHRPLPFFTSFRGPQP